MAAQDIHFLISFLVTCVLAALTVTSFALELRQQMSANADAVLASLKNLQDQVAKAIAVIEFGKTAASDAAVLPDVKSQLDAAAAALAAAVPQA